MIFYSVGNRDAWLGHFEIFYTYSFTMLEKIKPGFKFDFY